MITGQYTSMLQKLNLLTNECETIKPIGYQPEGRRYHKSLIVQDTLYVFGGSYNNNSNNIYLQDMFSIDLTNNVFTEIDQHGLIPSPRHSFSFFALEDKLYLLCGNSKSKYCQDFYAFNLKSSTWKAQNAKNEKCLLKRTFHSTVAVKESSRKLKVYLVGGKESKDSWLNNMNVITLQSNSIYWILHYLESTGIQYLIGLNMVQEIIELFE